MISSILCSFNSIKVQLEHLRVDTVFELFQFHKGSIRTVLILAVMIGLRLFQFHKGSIRTMKKKRKLFLSVVSIP